MNSTEALLTQLKSTVRTGWVEHGVANPESVAEHSLGTALLCLCYGTAAGVDAQRAASMAVIHDLAEAVTGDHPWRPDASPDRKHEAEGAAMATIGKQLYPSGAEESLLRELFDEYTKARSAEALFVRDMNLIDMALQAARYKSCDSGADLSEFIDSSRVRLGTPFGVALFRMFFEAPKTG